MKSLDQCKRIEVRQTDGTWVPAHWEQLEMGDIIRVYEGDHVVQYTDENGTRDLWVSVDEVHLSVNRIDEEGMLQSEAPEVVPNLIEHDDTNYDLEAVELLKSFDEGDFESSYEFKAHVIDTLEKGRAPQLLIEAVWRLISESEAEYLADEDGEFDESYDPDDEEDMPELLSDEPVTDMSDIFIPTTHCDRLLKQLFDKGMTDKAIADEMEAIGYQGSITQVKTKRHGYTRWLKTLNS